MENQNGAPKKSHTMRNVIILVVLIIFCLGIFSALASIFVSPGALTMIMDGISGGKMGEITSSLGSLGNNLVPGVNTPASEKYLIKQKSTLPFSIKAPKGVLDAKANIDFTTVGYAMSKSTAGNYGWQTDWKVIVNSITNDMGTKTQISGPGAHTSALTTTFTPSSMQYVYYFSLRGVKEGDTFPARYVQKNMGDATYHFNQKDWIFYDDKNKPVANISIGTQERNTDVSPPNDAKNIEAILVKDNGADGAIVGFKPVELTADQKAQLEAANSAVQGAGELSQWWNSQLYPMYTNLPQMPPFRIVQSGNLPEKGYFEEEITNAGYSNAASDANIKANPNDKNGDGIPDLVPLPGN